MDGNPLRNTTNSPPPPPTLHTKAYRKHTTNLWSSDESYRSSLTEIKDGIYNAERVASEDQIVDDTDEFCPSSHTPQIDPAIPVKQASRLNKQGIDTTSNALKFTTTATKHQKDKEICRSEKMLENDRNARLHYSEPLPGHSRSSSIDDHLRSCRSLDCLKSVNNGFATSKSWVKGYSTSSEEALASEVCTVLFPLSPCHPPVTRRSTPPGLPGFGTTEAQELRLTPASKSKLANIGRRVLRYITADDPPTQPNSDSGSSASTGAVQQHTNVPADMLKRMLGIARPVSLPVESYEPGRSKLPKGVKIAATTGALIQADDGTFVRGRWGPRTSGHGIGQRTIGVHPFARLRDSSAIDEAVREIDKAHEREQERRQRALPGDFPTTPSQSEATNAHIHSPNGRTVSQHPLRTSTTPNCLSAKRYAQLGHTSMPSQSSYQMPEPSHYSMSLRPDRPIDVNSTENAPENDGSRSNGGVVENQTTARVLQICWEWTCRPCNHFYFSRIVSESSGTHNIS